MTPLTYTDKYFNWVSNHYLEHQASIVKTLLRRAGKLVSDLSDREAEIHHVKSALRANEYKPWTLTILPGKQRRETITSTPSVRLGFYVEHLPASDPGGDTDPEP